MSSSLFIWARKPQGLCQQLVQHSVTPSLLFSSPFSFQKTPQDTKSPPSRSLGLKKRREGVGQWSDLDLCVSETRASEREKPFICKQSREEGGGGERDRSGINERI